MYYVYQYLREDGTPYYIGKGKGNRAWYKGKHERIKIPVDPERIVIIQENLTETEALDLETSLIAKHGRKDIGTGILRNLTDGGEGISGARFGRPPEERIQKIADALRGKVPSDETRKKMSISHTGLKDSNDTREKKSIAAKKPKTETHKKNISLSKQGDKNPMHGKDSPFKDKLHSEESKAKIKEARAKQVCSEETKRKMSESQKRRHAEKKTVEMRNT